MDLSTANTYRPLKVRFCGHTAYACAHVCECTLFVSTGEGVRGEAQGTHRLWRSIRSFFVAFFPGICMHAPMRTHMSPIACPIARRPFPHRPLCDALSPNRATPFPHRTKPFPPLPSTLPTIAHDALFPSCVTPSPHRARHYFPQYVHVRMYHSFCFKKIETSGEHAPYQQHAHIQR